MVTGFGLVLSLGACSARVEGANSDGIWFREPFIGGWDMTERAEEHCSKYGKQATLQGTMAPAQGYALPIVAYNCQ